MPTTDVIDVSIEVSVHERVGEVSKEKTEKQMNMATKGKSKWKSKTYVAKKVDSRNEKGIFTKEKGAIQDKERYLSWCSKRIFTNNRSHKEQG